MANHLHGYHGSTKDICIYCGSGEDGFCQKATDEEHSAIRKKDARLNIVRNIKAKLTKMEWDTLYWVLTTNDRYEI